MLRCERTAAIYNDELSRARCRRRPELQKNGSVPGIREAPLVPMHPTDATLPTFLPPPKRLAKYFEIGIPLITPEDASLTSSGEI